MPECEAGENNRDLPYDQPWLKNAIPLENGKLDHCHRFSPKNRTIIEPTNQCSANMFDSSTKIACTEYIYASDEKNIQTEVYKAAKCSIHLIFYHNNKISTTV